MSAPGPFKFTCNICGAECSRPPEGLGRETENCAACGSTVRLRALIALLSREMFGVLLALPEFPVLKGIRGIGMSDAPELAERLAEKFDYTNTFYHQAPVFDVTTPDDRDRGRYDFIVSSEVMEHVPPPVERVFATLFGMLKPDGLLLLTTPYTLGGTTREHFPDLHEFTLASVGQRTVLINRRRDGSIEVFENLIFHGGHGSTVEVREFTEDSLRSLLERTGFDAIHFAGENVPEFGVEHSENWSLPIAARKGNFQPPAAELALQYREACRLAARKIRDLEAITAEYERHSAHHELAHAQWVRDTEVKNEWVQRVEAVWEDRTKWALELKQERDRAIAEFRRVEAEEAAASGQAAELRKKLDEARAELARIQAARWSRLGRKLRML
ncbi:MAG TPA: methyltransferase domain-containing protein [Bryobacteraceae bacterium]|nr:methyltransferase domain-containing protein [Bryobacteraceae bacterium]